MKVQVIRKVKEEIDVDIESIIENLIGCNIDYIIDCLMDEFVEDPLSYINDDIIIDEDVQIALNSCIIKKLNEKLSELC